jgi:hypothetical protein
MVLWQIRGVVRYYVLLSSSLWICTLSVVALRLDGDDEEELQLSTARYPSSSTGHFPHYSLSSIINSNTEQLSSNRVTNRTGMLSRNPVRTSSFVRVRVWVRFVTAGSCFWLWYSVIEEIEEITKLELCICWHRHVSLSSLSSLSLMYTGMKRSIGTCIRCCTICNIRNQWDATIHYPKLVWISPVLAYLWHTKAVDTAAHGCLNEWDTILVSISVGETMTLTCEARCTKVWITEMPQSIRIEHRQMAPFDSLITWMSGLSACNPRPQRLT